MRVNDVIMIRIDGAIDSTVSSAISWIARSVTPPLPWPRLMLISCANAGSASDPAAIRMAKNKTLRGKVADLTKETSDGPAGMPSRLPDSQSRSSRRRGAPAAAAVRRCGAGAAGGGSGATGGAPIRGSARRRAGAGRLRAAAPSRRDSGRPLDSGGGAGSGGRRRRRGGGGAAARSGARIGGGFGASVGSRRARQSSAQSRGSACAARRGARSRLGRAVRPRLGSGVMPGHRVAAKPEPTDRCARSGDVRQRRRAADLVGERGAGRARRRLGHLRLGDARRRRRWRHRRLQLVGIRQRRDPRRRFGADRPAAAPSDRAPGMARTILGSTTMSVGPPIIRRCSTLSRRTSTSRRRPSTAAASITASRGIRPRLVLAPSRLPANRRTSQAASADQRQHGHEREEECQCLHTWSPANGVFFSRFSPSQRPRTIETANEAEIRP